MLNRKLKANIKNLERKIESLNEELQAKDIMLRIEERKVSSALEALYQQNKMLEYLIPYINKYSTYEIDVAGKIKLKEFEGQNIYDMVQRAGVR